MGWLIALGILVLLAILPLGVSVAYDCDGLNLDALVGLLHIRLLPKEEKSPKKEKKKRKRKRPRKAENLGPLHPTVNPRSRKRAALSPIFCQL